MLWPKACQKLHKDQQGSSALEANARAGASLSKANEPRRANRSSTLPRVRPVNRGRRRAELTTLLLPGRPTPVGTCSICFIKPDDARRRTRRYCDLLELRDVSLCQSGADCIALSAGLLDLDPSLAASWRRRRETQSTRRTRRARGVRTTALLARTRPLCLPWLPPGPARSLCGAPSCTSSLYNVPLAGLFRLDHCYHQQRWRLSRQRQLAQPTRAARLRQRGLQPAAATARRPRRALAAVRRPAEARG